MKRTYSTEFKRACAAGFVPEQILRKIPRSTLHSFLFYDHNKPFGAEFVNDTMTVLRGVSNSSFLMRFNRVYLYTFATLESVFTLSGIDLKILYSKESVRRRLVKFIDRTKDTFGFERILRALHISRNTFYRWKEQKKGVLILY